MVELVEDELANPIRARVGSTPKADRNRPTVNCLKGRLFRLHRIVAGPVGAFSLDAPMTTDQFRNALRAKPFRPFDLKTGDGAHYVVNHPETALLTQGGRTVFINTGGEDVAILDLLLVHAIEFANPSASAN